MINEPEKGEDGAYIFDKETDVYTIAKEQRQKERDKDAKDFTKINLLENFCKMRNEYLDICKQGQKIEKGKNMEQIEMSQNIRYETELYDKLCKRIQENIDRRQQHQVRLDMSNQMIREISNRALYI